MSLWFLIWLPKITYLLFVVAFGGCVGSLINVLAYRMPLGLSVVTPPSRCPKCGTRLSWRDNIPVFGWLFLRGKCRYCREKISPEYPIVEASVALLFGLFYAIYFMVPDGAVWLGVPVGRIKPEWAMSQPGMVWPTFTLLLILLGALAAMTIVDAKTSTIPLEMTWVPAAAAVVIHPVHAWWMEHRWLALKMPYAPPPWIWPIPTPLDSNWWWIGASIGGVVGLGVAVLLLRFGWIRRSFADYAEWEKSVLGAGQPASDAAAAAIGSAPPPAEPTPAQPTVVDTHPIEPVAAGAPEEMWIQYPHARREMVKELAFLAPCVGLAWLGGWAAEHWIAAGTSAPLWLLVLSGVLLGYLIGGGIVWGMRLAGSLALNKEAMGLGDVHMMAAVGACLGWIDSGLAFFLAAFVGLFWTLISTVFSGSLRRAMPYGPYLAVATVLVLLGKPLIEAGLSQLTGTRINLP